MVRKRVGILISGRGSNMAALIEAARADDYPAEIVAVVSNRPKAAGLKTAKQAGITAIALDHKAYDSREGFEEVLDGHLREAGCDLICNAGFMRLLTGGFVKKWLNRQLNIHPSLLPAYKGVHTHERAIADGVRLAGCTVHFLRAEMDAGPIIMQAAVPVLPGDDGDTLAARVLKVEHRIYPQALRLVASGAARVVGEQVVISGAPKLGTDPNANLIVPQIS